MPNSPESLDLRFAKVLDILDSGASRPRAKLLREVLASPPSRTMSDWFVGRHGRRVDTIQLDNYNGAVWAPMARRIDAESGKTFVELDGSRRDYRGMTVRARTDSALVVSDDWHTIAYLLSPES